MGAATDAGIGIGSGHLTEHRLLRTQIRRLSRSLLERLPLYPGPLLLSIRLVSRVRDYAAFQSNFCSASRVMWRPMGMDEVAAGEGAFRTWMVRSVSPIRKSWTIVPSASTAWARTPAR